MNKMVWTALVLLLSVALLGCASTGQARLTEVGQRQEVPPETGEDAEKAVKSLVEEFGGQLSKVSLLAPEDLVGKSMQEHYADFVSPALLAEWTRDPQNAPGRLTSSPWPDRIEIASLEKRSETSYEVRGEILEVTSVEMTSGGVAARRPITLLVTRTGGRWLIEAVTLGKYQGAEPVMYRNDSYGFRFSLPESWEGFSIVAGEWQGRAIEGPRAGEVVERGPVVSIRHPQWTAENPRQDIPIMIFTPAQWDALQDARFSVSAAPIGPKELGRNAAHVFALPPRYNFSFPPGFEEVEEILGGHPLKTDPPS